MATGEVIQELPVLHKEWTISFEYFAFHPQPQAPEPRNSLLFYGCAQIFHVEYYNKEQGRESIISKWCIDSISTTNSTANSAEFSRLKIQTIPNKNRWTYIEVDNAWSTGNWNRVELTQRMEYKAGHITPVQFWLVLKVNGEEVYREQVLEPDPVRNVKAVLGQYTSYANPSAHPIVNSQGPLNVYLDNFKIETWDEDPPFEEEPSLEPPADLVLQTGNGTCMDGWTSVYDLCVKIPSEWVYRTWYGARDHCWSMQSTLARIDTIFHDRAIGSLSPHFIWIGATDRAQEGVWKDAMGQELEYFNWDHFQPDNSQNRQHCAHIQWGQKVEQKWNDNNCLLALPKAACAYKKYGELESRNSDNLKQIKRKMSLVEDEKYRRLPPTNF